jgi:hypothetical protein
MLHLDAQACCGSSQSGLVEPLAFVGRRGYGQREAHGEILAVDSAPTVDIGT